MTYIRIALAFLRLINTVMQMVQREQWMNEGERRLIAKQLKEENDALAKTLGIANELRELNHTEIIKLAEKALWLRD